MSSDESHDTKNIPAQDDNDTNAVTNADTVVSQIEEHKEDISDPGATVEEEITAEDNVENPQDPVEVKEVNVEEPVKVDDVAIEAPAVASEQTLATDPTGATSEGLEESVKDAAVSEQSQAQTIPKEGAEKVIQETPASVNE